MNNGFVGREGRHVLLSGSALTLPFCSASQVPERELGATASPVAESLVREIEEMERVWRTGLGPKEGIRYSRTLAVYPTERDAWIVRERRLSEGQAVKYLDTPVEITLADAMTAAVELGATLLVLRTEAGQDIKRWPL